MGVAGEKFARERLELVVELAKLNKAFSGA
jgi:hypothetical protein